jgi:putative YhbY family RNA-binding protein
METLSPAQRRALRAKAHHLHPVVSIGHHGLTPAVLKEIDVNLTAHELIKIRVFADARDERVALLASICAALGAEAVQHLGKLLIVWRPAPMEDVAPPRHRKPADKSAAKKAPQVRRPRSPLPRVPARPPRGKAPFEAPGAPKQRRRGADTGRQAAPAAGDRSRRRRRGMAGTAATPTGTTSARRAVPHGKSASSIRGASGARRRRKAR